MKADGINLGRRQVADETIPAMMATTERIELYCAAHPGSPAAVRRPQLFTRGDLLVALLGSSVQEGIVGIGPTVEAALSEFDRQYLASLRPPIERPIAAPKRRQAVNRHKAA